MILEFEIIWILKIIGLLLWYILMPGFLFQILFLKKSLLIERVGNSFAYGFVLFSILAFAAYLFQLEFVLLHKLFFVINPILLIIVFFQFRKSRKTFSEIFSRSMFKPGKMTMLILLIAISGFVISLFSGWYPRGDAAIHLQVLRNMMSSDTVANAFYSLQGNPAIPDHAYDSYYVFLAMVSRFSGLELSVVWHYVSPVFAILLPFVLYSLLKSLTKNNTIIASSLIGFFFFAAVYPQIMYGSVYDALVYPNRVYLWLILPIAFLAFFNYLANGSAKNIFATALLVASMLLVHQNGFLFFNIIIAGFAALALLFGKPENVRLKSVFIGLGLVLLISFPLLILKLTANLDYINQSSSVVWHKHYSFVYLTEHIFAFSPKTYYKSGMLLAFLLVVYLVLRLRKLNSERLLILFVASGFFATVLIVFNPFVVPWLSKIISYVAIIRMLRMPMYFILAGLILALIFAWLEKKNRVFEQSKLKMVILIVFASVAFLVASIRVLKKNPHHELPLIYELRSIIVENSVVLSDPLTSTDIAEFQKVNTVVIQFNGAADLVDINKEKEDVSYLLNDSIFDKKEAFRILDEYNVDYVVVDYKKNKPAFDFSLQKTIFDEVYNKDSVLVFHYYNKQTVR